jgi:DNA-binding MarR family transcriptional regulator
MATPAATLGTLLRHLIDILDGAVDEAYVQAGLDYRPRYTPIMRVLLERGPSSIRSIASSAGMTHSAVSQTVAQMVKRGLVKIKTGGDAREHIVVLTPAAKAMVPALQRQWAATTAAVRTLDAELSAPLSDLLRETIDVLEATPFADRIERAAATLTQSARQRS